MNAKKTTKTLTILVALAAASFAASPALADGYLANGSAVTLSGAAGSQGHFQVVVPAGASRLEVTTAGGWGDLDLFVRYGAAATAHTHNGRSTGNANSERIAVSNPRAGTWHILALGYRPYSQAQLRVNVTGGNAPYNKYPKDDKNYTTTNALVVGQPLYNLAGSRGSVRYLQLEIPGRARAVEVRTVGGYGDVDVYAADNALPTTSRYDARSTGSSTAERIVLNSRGRDREVWNLMLVGYRDFAGVTIQATVTEWGGPGRHSPGPSRPVPGPQPRPFGRPVATLTNPTAGEVWRLGGSYTVRWTSQNIRHLRVQFSTDDGRSWRNGNLPAEIEANVGSHTIRLTDDATQFVSETFRLRLVDVDRRQVVALSGRFAVRRREPVRPGPGRGRARQPGGRTGRRNDNPYIDQTPGRRPQIGPDNYEPDNSYNDPTHLEFGQAQTHTVGPGDEDYIRFTTDRTGYFNVSFSNAGGPLVVDVYVRKQGRDNTLVGSYAVRNGSTLTVGFEEDTYWYTFRVRTAGRQNSSYRVSVRPR